MTETALTCYKMDTLGLLNLIEDSLSICSKKVSKK